MGWMKQDIRELHSLTEIFLVTDEMFEKKITLINGERDEVSFTYAELYQRSLKVLSVLQTRGLSAGDQLIFQLDDNYYFMVTFWACLLGGIIPVPVTVGRNTEHRLKLFKIWKVLDNPYLISSDTALMRLEDFAEEEEMYDLQRQIAEHTLLVSEISEIDHLAAGVIQPANPDDLAFIQFSSGSTGDPKGVMLTHRNLLANINGIIQSSQVTSDDKYLGWMPLTHDMGIIGWHLTPLFATCDQYIIPTEVFIRHPVLWIKKVDEHQATILSSPNFGYRHFLKFFNPERIQSLDLSRVKIIFNGAEPISVDLCGEFLNALTPFGLKPETMTPCYGMAEACLGVTISPLDQPVETLCLDRQSLSVGDYVREVSKDYYDQVTFVKVGTAIEDCQFRICDEAGAELVEGQIGYVLIGGVNVTRGYYNNPLATKSVLSEGWLNTGDLGLVYDGQLVITGRAKDIIFINGQNYYPHDIERVAEELAEIELNKIAVCGVFDAETSSEQVICFVIFKKRLENFAPLALELKKHISKMMGIEVADVIPVKQLPKTTSGKLQRYKLAEEYRQGNFAQQLAELHNHFNQLLAEQAIEQPTNPIEETLVELSSQVLQIEQIPINADLREYGLNSLKAVNLLLKIRQSFHVELTLRELFMHPMIKELANKIKQFEKHEFSQVAKISQREYYRASSVQKRLFALQQLTPDETSYNLPYMLMVEGIVDIKTLKQALKTLILRHTALRTTFELIDGELMQKIAVDSEVTIGYSEGTNSELPRITEEFIKPFDLGTGPLFRMELVTLPERQLLMFDMHHIISDGRSMNIFLKELFDLYSGNVLAEITVQYTDYVAWQEEFFTSERYQAEEDFWLEVFADEVPVLNLPTDYPRPSVLQNLGDVCYFDLDCLMTDRLREIAKTHNGTLFMVLLSAYYLLLSRYSGQEDLVVGTAVSGRNHPDVQNLLGMFVNTLGLRGRVDGKKRFSEFLTEIKDHCWQAFENQDYQFEMLVDRLSLSRSLCRNVLFDVMIVLQEGSKASLEIVDLCLTPYRVPLKNAKYDLTLHVFEVVDGLNFELEYNTELFTGETINRLSRHLLNLLQEIARDPELLISDYQMLSQTELEVILKKFNATQVSYPKAKTIDQLFAEQVVMNPGKIALVYEDESLSYWELNVKANQLARKLRTLGVKPDQAVGVLAQPSIEMLIGVLAVVKAGGCYLPIDVNYPIQRIQHMISDANCEILLTVSPEDAYNSQCLVLNLKEPENYTGDFGDLTPVNQAEDLIYIIYTSGSTGEPKGVMVQHRNVNRLVSNSNMLVIEKDERIMQTGSLAFDASTFEIWGSFLNGATLYLVNQNTLLSTNRFEEKMREYGITMIWMTAPLFNQLFAENPVIFAGLQKLIIGGDVVSPWHVKQVKEMFGDLRIINGYGPTESTTFTTFYEIDSVSLEGNIPIGRPVSNTQVYILDNNQNIQPIGAAGELYIGGDGLARGYLNQPELTATKFIKHPLNGGTRLYRTGDLARWLADGNIEFLGRIDAQVKIRGFRIEIGEIEGCLKQYSEIKEVVVIARNDQAGQKYLCAYLVMNAELTISEIRKKLSEQLPDYMIPGHFIQLEKMPLTANGKIDRQALPEPEFRDQSSVYVAPETEEEVRLALLWKQVLGVARVGIRDNFFEMGGHSLKATFLASRIFKEFNIEIPIKEVFNHPTIEKMLEFMQTYSKSKYIQIPKAKEQPFYPVSSAQKRLYIINQREKPNITYNVPYVKKVEGHLDVKSLQCALKELVKRHESLRTSFIYQHEEVVQVIQQKVDLPFSQFEVNEAEWQQVVQEFIRPFDLSQAPLMRVGLITGQEGQLFMLDIHHIVADGVALGVMLDELISLYYGQVLAEPILQYKDYAVWQKNLGQSDALHQQEEYWVKRFADEIPLLNLPTDYPRPLVKSYQGSSLFFKLSQRLTKELNNLAVNQGVTLYMVLLAAYNILLYKYTGQNDLVIGSATAGRQHPDLERLVGVCINSLPLRNRPEKEKTYLEFLAEVKSSTLAAYENQDYQFDMLIERLELVTDTSRNPVYDHMFGLQNVDLYDVETKDFAFKPYEFSYKISKLDSILLGEETEEGLNFRLEYSVDLFKEETMQRFAQHFRELLQAIVRKPESRIAELSLLNPDELTEVLSIFNQTQRDYELKTITQLFTEQVEIHSTKPAIVYGNQSLTYGELNARVNQLARRLRDLGVGVEQIVGIMLERSLDLYISKLAVLKSGGAYLPIDYQYPKQRIEYMLNDSGAKILLTREDLAVDMSFADDVVLIREDIYSGDSSNLEIMNQPTDLAYVIYTSGSTGKPKGVLVEHKGISNLHYFFEDTLGIMASDRIIQFANVSFDASVWETFMTLLSGATLYPVPREVIDNYSKFTDFINTYAITVMTLPPVYLAHLNPKALKTLRKVITAGSTTNFELVKNWQDKVEYINAYGPTETTICATIWKASPGDYKSVPIGRPISNTQVFIVNEDLQPQPIGVVGELCVQGVSLARGYLNRSDLTDERFIEVAISPREKVYRTGDLARWLADGNIEFSGRIDQQVKVRGFRIEPGEIESELIRYPGISDAIIIDRVDSLGDVYLCGYYLSPEPIDQRILKEYLKEILPEYMVPTYLVQLAEFPLTSSGKVERKNLPNPELVDRKIEVAKPRNYIESKLLEIWKEVLGREELGIEDNFFELGGHSLKATQLAAVTFRELNVELSLMEVFERPTIALMADYIKGVSQSEFVSIEPVDIREFYPVSSAQKRLFALREMEGVSITYNMPGVWEVVGELNLPALRIALKKLIQRHEALRTVFAIVAGEPVQRVQQEVEFTLEEYYVEAGEFSKVFQEFIRPFDLQGEPLFRAGMLYAGTEKQFLLLDMHHIIADGFSLEIMFNDLTQLYQGKELKPLRIQYKDFAVWQNEFCQSAELAKEEEFWLTQFANEIPVLNLPTDFPRPIVRNFTGERIHLTIAENLTEKIQHLTQTTDSTLYIVLLAAFNLLLAKYTGEEDIIIGSPIAGRSHADLENIVGMFVNTLAMRNYPTGKKSFRQFVEEVKEHALRAYAHQNYQFEMLVDKLGLHRDLGRNPLFDVMFAVQNANRLDFMLGDLQLIPQPFVFPISKFDWTFNVIERERGLLCILEFNTSLFTEETIRRYFEHYVWLLEQIVDNPDQCLSKIQVLTPDEREQILDNFNQTQVSYLPKTLIQLFEEQVELHPDRRAVIMNNEQLTYEELNLRVNHLAHTLSERGIKAGELVGLLIDRSLEVVIGILGILKSGAAYLPIDPTYPEERINYMIEDSEIKYLVTRESLVAEKPFRGLDCLYLDQIENGSLSSNPQIINHPTDLAYVIYTSGSTGKPKGVIVEHRGITNTICWRRDEYELTTDDRVLQLFSFSFDGFLTSFFTPLVSGSEIYLLNEKQARDVLAIKEIITNERITHCICVPSLYRVILENISSEEISSLKIVTLAGEEVYSELVRLSKTLNPNLEVVNEYGPTENSVATTVQRDVYPDSRISIGRPIANVQVYILDQYLNPVPIGVPGELCISGEGLARGYLHRPELTAERFVKNPWSEGYLYRTGDQGMWLANGQIVFLGRVDQQVKIRGYRIEPLEIERQLQQAIIQTASHGIVKIRDVVVLARQFAQKIDLVAYLVTTKPLTVSELRQYLVEKLPDYMIPTHYVFLDKLPLLANGKVDRDSLLKLNEFAEVSTDFVAPESAVEVKIAEVWQQVLGKLVGIEDNYFELGGDSIKAIQIVARLKTEGINTSVQDLFQYRTIKELIYHVSLSESLEVIDQGIVSGEIPHTAITARFFAEDYVNPEHWNQSLLLKLPTEVRVEWLEKAITHLISHHDILRVNVKEGMLYQQNRHLGQPLVFERYDLSRLTAEEQLVQLRNIGEELKAGFDLRESLLLKGAVFDLGSNGLRLLLTIHHLAIDGVSWRIILEDLTTLYEQQRSGSELKLALKTHSFKEWAERIQEYSQSELLAEEIGYWQTVETRFIPLFRGEEFKAKTLGDSITTERTLSVEETRLLLTKANAAYNTEVNELLLVGLARSVKKLTKEAKLLIHLEGHGREEIFRDLDISRTVGWFTSLYPLALELKENLLLSEEIKMLKEQIRKVPNRGFGYGILKYLSGKLSNSSNSSRDFWPNIVFNYLGQFETTENSFFKLAKEATGPDICLKNHRSALLEITCMVSAEQFRVLFNYPDNDSLSETILKLLDNYLSELRELIAHCTREDVGGYTPSDFDLIDVDQDFLDELVEDLF